MKIQAISLWQPFASLIAFGEKHIETRHWPFRGDLPAFLAIHAAQKWNRELAELTLQQPFDSALHGHGLDRVKGPRGKISSGNLPFGKILCVVRVVQCVSTNMLPLPGQGTSFAGSVTLAAKILGAYKNERAFGDYTYGRYAWVFDKRLLLEKPIKEKGRQALWQWEPPADVQEWMDTINQLT